MDTKPQQFSFLKLLYVGLCITLAYTADKELQIVEGEALREQCNPSLVPTVGDLHWQKENDTHFYENGTVLVIQNINRNDTGVYRCVSHDRKTGANSVVEIVNIDVLYPPRPRDHTRFNVSAVYGQSALLILEYEGNPSPSLTWYHEGQELPVNVTGTVENIAGYVNLTNIDFGDYGNYTAVLNNSVGSYQAVYTVIPKGTPDSPTNLTVTNITSTTATLHWKSGFDWASPQYFKVYLHHENDLTFPIKESERIPDTSGTHGIGANFTYTMTGLYPDTSYVMFVGAGNRWDMVGLSVSWGISVRTKSGPANAGSCLRRGGLTVSSVLATLFSLVLVTSCYNH